jgi:hypothetical protein
VYLGIVLAYWPWTRGLSRGLFGLALTPLQALGLGLVAKIPQLVFLVVLFLLIRFTLKIIRLFFEAVGRGTVALSGFDSEWAEPTYKIVRIAVVALALVVAYPYIPGSTLPPSKACPCSSASYSRSDPRPPSPISSPDT